MSTPRRPTAGRRPARPGARPARTLPRAAARPGTTAGPESPPDSPPVAGRQRGRRPSGVRRRSPLTPRGAVLALVACGLLVSAALPLREYVNQRGEIAELEQAQAEARERVAALEAERDRLQDPAYVAAEARRRLHFVLPGETAYVVLTPEGSAAEAAAEGPAGASAPWYSQVWGSVQEADRPSAAGLAGRAP